MATPRKRSNSSSGFSSKETETLAEATSVEEFLDEVATEMFETISQEEEAHVEEKAAPAVEEPPVVTPIAPVVTFVPQEITPTEDAGPRFIEAPQAAPVRPKAEAPVLKAPPKRHPRNIPRFTPHKK